jgi:hypothetical protein
MKLLQLLVASGLCILAEASFFKHDFAVCSGR